jgi:hypothetical protein
MAALSHLFVCVSRWLVHAGVPLPSTRTTHAEPIAVAAHPTDQTTGSKAISFATVSVATAATQAAQPTAVPTEVIPEMHMPPGIMSLKSVRPILPRLHPAAVDASTLCVDKPQFLAGCDVDMHDAVAQNAAEDGQMCTLADETGMHENHLPSVCTNKRVQNQVGRHHLQGVQTLVAHKSTQSTPVVSCQQRIFSSDELYIPSDADPPTSDAPHSKNVCKPLSIDAAEVACGSTHCGASLPGSKRSGVQGKLETDGVSHSGGQSIQQQIMEAGKGKAEGSGQHARNRGCASEGVLSTSFIKCNREIAACFYHSLASCSPQGMVLLF